MKNIFKTIYESGLFQRASEIKTQMFFAETAQLLLFIGEMAGQISDGKYENDRPYNHWLWVASNDNEYITKASGDLGYISNYEHVKKYTITDFIKYIKNGQKWANRMLCYCKLGHVLDDLKVFKANDKVDYNEASALCDVIEYIGEENIKTLDELKEDEVPKYLETSLDKAKKYLTDEVLSKFNEYEYDVKKLKEDMAQMDETVNTYLGDKFK